MSRTPRFRLRLANSRIASQAFFFALFLFFCYATVTSRLGGYPVSRLLEADPLVGIATFLATGYLYRFLGYGLIVIALTFLFGRVFCNWICPFGTLHQAIGWLFNIRKASERIASNRYDSSYRLKYGLLVVLLVSALFGSLQIGLLDPICLIYRSFTATLAPAADMAVSSVSERTGVLPQPLVDQLLFKPGTDTRLFTGSFLIGIVFLTFVAANLYRPRIFCRLLCPLGALLGLLSRFSLFRIDRDVHRCTDCDLCLTRCEGAADPQGKLRLSECFACMNCLDDCPEDALRFSILALDRKQVLPAPDLSRRQWLFASTLGLFAYPLLKTHGLDDDRNFSPSLIRPPGSVEEQGFLMRCIKCDQCLNVCPTNVLQPAAFHEGGLEALWTPILNFRIGHCQLTCTLCSVVCPTGAIREISAEEKLGLGRFEQQGPIVLGTAFFDKGRCLPHAMQIPCVVCEEVCPVAPKAIQTVDVEELDAFGRKILLNKPYLVPELCIGCGICEKECPVQDSPAVYVTAVGESRSQARRLLLQSREE